VGSDPSCLDLKISTRFTTLVACNAPLQLAAMGGVGTPELAEAVVAAGGLGMVPGLPATPGACGVNFLVPFAPDLETAKLCGDTWG